MDDFSAHRQHLQRDGAATVSDVVDYVIASGLARRASDIHLEPLPDALAVRFRLDGMLHEMGRLPRAAGARPRMAGRDPCQGFG